MNSKKKQILITNDDGFESPGIWAVADVLANLGQVTVSAPSSWQSAVGRGFDKSKDGAIEKRTIKIKDREYEGYSINGTPSSVVLHALFEILPEKPDLVVSGINYGANVSTDITYSGTVGAAIEAASLGVPALATSLQMRDKDWYTYHDFDFSVTAEFTRFFADLILNKGLPNDVHILNLVVPFEATRDTPWEFTRIAPGRYYNPYVIRDGDLDGSAHFSSKIIIKDNLPKDSDIFVREVKRTVSVTPISLDMTSRIGFDELSSFYQSK
jgi:5'-nucleotidase